MTVSLHHLEDVTPEPCVCGHCVRHQGPQTITDE